jgi:cellulose synthase/poly-beta-1,6-N-acetylglucosamine synthase-like glycosyltransferase
MSGQIRPQRDMAVVSAIVPCLNEEAAIGEVVAGLLANGADEVVVVDGGSQASPLRVRMPAFSSSSTAMAATGSTGRRS